MQAVARPLPVIVIAELLGVPLADRGNFRVWSEAIIRATPLPRAVPTSPPPGRAVVT